MTTRLDVMPKTTEQNWIVHTGKSEAEVTNNKKLRSRYCTIEAIKLTTDRHDALQGLFVTAELLVSCCDQMLAERMGGLSECVIRQLLPCYLHLATSEMWCWSEGREILTELSLCYSITYHCNDAAHWYEQFLQIGRLDRDLILFDLALYRPSASVFVVFMVLYIFEIFC